MSASATSVSAEAQGEPNTVAALSNILECSICLQVVCQPICVPCGHTFCRSCLVSSMKVSRKKCPSCRAVCLIDPVQSSECRMLADLARAVLGVAAYTERLEEATRQLQEIDQTLPVFFYNDPANLPGCLLALHFFEPRYRLMMERITEAHRRFLYLPLRRHTSNTSDLIGEIGLVAELIDSLRLPDGRWHIRARLRRRVRVQSHWVEDGTLGLSYCTVKEVVDTPVEDGQLAGLVEAARRVKEKVVEGLDRLDAATRQELTESVGSEPGLSASYPSVQALESMSFWLSSCIASSALGPVAPTAFDSFEVLYTQSTGSRLAACQAYFDRMAAHQQHQPQTSRSGSSLSRLLSGVAQALSQRQRHNISNEGDAGDEGEENEEEMEGGAELPDDGGEGEGGRQPEGPGEAAGDESMHDE
ncbi:unnamed protein product [Vitrella brassicaformis CCMP3155]|uniref:RING-type domain-containing protein n=2 Tax=Vitrella brassicaformis TaxID=1169539 RepID=A0A0G4EDH1_VITBC|nr:unnamed protein product [Vitrella brassicaformis CCMP3155]|eukprot:CEL94050.1 unnamed protein product [Vitrella brassicaformis CCMP3155]